MSPAHSIFLVGCLGLIPLLQCHVLVKLYDLCFPDTDGATWLCHSIECIWGSLHFSPPVIANLQSIELEKQTSLLLLLLLILPLLGS